MVTGFERSTRVRIPKNDAKTYHDFVTRDPAFEASDKSLAVVVHRKGQPEDAMDVDENAHAILAAWEGFPAVSYADDERVSVAMHGHISNAPRPRALRVTPRGARHLGGSPPRRTTPTALDARGASPVTKPPWTPRMRTRTRTRWTVPTPPPPTSRGSRAPGSCSSCTSAGSRTKTAIRAISP